MGLCPEASSSNCINPFFHYSPLLPFSSLLCSSWVHFPDEVTPLPTHGLQVCFGDTSIQNSILSMRSWSLTVWALPVYA